MGKQYDSLGKDYLRLQKSFLHAREDAARKFLYSQVKTFRNKRVLDLGCGAGPDLVYLEKHGSVAFGVDNSRVMISEAKKVVKNPRRVYFSSMEKLPFPDKSFDIVTSRFALHYLHSFEKTYREIHRVLKRGGWFLSVVHHPLEGWFYQRPRQYGKKGLVVVPIYRGAIKLQFPAHTIAEYFSLTFTRYFDLRSVVEEKLKSRDHPSMPGFLGWSATKR